MSEAIKVNHLYPILATDDAHKAFHTLMTKRREEPDKDWSMAETRLMADPPETIYKWVVFRILKREF